MLAEDSSVLDLENATIDPTSNSLDGISEDDGVVFGELILLGYFLRLLFMITFLFLATMGH